MEWIEEPVDRQVKMGTVDEVRFTAKLSAKGKKAKWYMRNQVCCSAQPRKQSHPGSVCCRIYSLYSFALLNISNYLTRPVGMEKNKSVINAILCSNSNADFSNVLNCIGYIQS